LPKKLNFLFDIQLFGGRNGTTPNFLVSLIELAAAALANTPLNTETSELGEGERGVGSNCVEIHGSNAIRYAGWGEGAGEGVGVEEHGDGSKGGIPNQ
jgi:hypothetical protein